MYAACVDCGNRFLRAQDEHWKTRCLRCFIRMKRAQEQPAGYAGCRDCGARFQTTERLLWWPSCWARRQREFQQKYQQNASPGPQTPGACGELPKRLRGLIQLCHPDRHGGSELATTITQWLVKVRQELERTS